MNTPTTPCVECGAPVESVEINGRVLRPNLCDTCEDALHKREEEKQKAHAEAAREAQWERICPPLYRKTDLGQLPAEMVSLVLGWKPLGGQGLGILGASGNGKTRIAFHRLRQLFDENIPVFAVSAKRLERAVHHYFSDNPTKQDAAESLLEAVRSVEVLFIDDLGKEKFTERVAVEFFDLIEHRASYLLPTIWTSNHCAQDLENRLGGEWGPAVVRRLREFSKIVTA